MSDAKTDAVPVEKPETADPQRRNLALALFGALGGAAFLEACASTDDPRMGGEAIGQIASALAPGTNVYWVDNIWTLQTFAGADNWVAVLAGWNEPGDGGGGVFVWLSTLGVVPGDGGITVRPNIGGCWRRLYSGPVDIRWFGARLGTDCTTAINKAMAACVQLGGGSIFIPAGVWKFTSTLLVVSNIIITGVGEASTLSYGGAGAAIEVYNGASKITFRDFALNIDGSVMPPATPTIGFSLPSAWDVLLDNVNVKGGFSEALVKIWTKDALGVNAANITLSHCTLYGQGGGAGGGDGLKLDVDTVGGPGPGPICVFGGRIDGCDAYSLRCTPNATWYRLLVHGTILEGSYLGAVKADSLWGSSFTGCHFENQVGVGKLPVGMLPDANGIGGTQSYAVLMQLGNTTGSSCRGVSVSNCFFGVKYAANAIQVRSTTGQLGISFTGNEFLSMNDPAPNTTSKSAVSVRSQAAMSLISNDVYGTWNPVGPAATKLLDEWGPPRALLVVDDAGIQTNGVTRHGYGTAPQIAKAVVAFTNSDRTLGQAEYNCEALECTGELTGNRSLIFPTTEPSPPVPIAAARYLVKNGTTGGFAIVCGLASGSATVSIAPGTAKVIYNDGTGIFG